MEGVTARRGVGALTAGRGWPPRPQTPPLSLIFSPPLARVCDQQGHQVGRDVVDERAVGGQGGSRVWGWQRDGRGGCGGRAWRAGCRPRRRRRRGGIGEGGVWNDVLGRLRGRQRGGVGVGWWWRRAAAQPLPPPQTLGPSSPHRELVEGQAGVGREQGRELVHADQGDKGDRVPAGRKRHAVRAGGGQHTAIGQQGPHTQQDLQRKRGMGRVVGGRARGLGARHSPPGAQLHTRHRHRHPPPPPPLTAPTPLLPC